MITGAGSGLGRAMSVAMSKAGASLILTDINAAGLQETAAMCQARQPLELVPADIAQSDILSSIVKRGNEAVGEIDILINNAGIGPSVIRGDFLDNPIRFWELTPEILQRFFAVNCIAAFTLSALVAPGMIHRGWGRIINVTTSLDSMLHMAPYGLTKASLEAHAAVMANDLKDSGVTANVLVPGGTVATSMTGQYLAVAADRMLQAEIMGPPAVWLSSTFADNVSGRRFNAAKWDASLPADQAAQRASAPVAWSGYGDKSIQPM